MTALRYLSVCSGIEAATQAWHPLGWQCAGVSEIEPFPRAVLEQRIGAVPVDAEHRWHPGSNTIPLFGDFTRIEAHHVGPIDLLVGGTPCQSFSIAGKRLGLDDPRGNLTLEFLALARRVRPRWIVWENVPGVLSHDDGRTMGTFLRLVGECGFRWAYRVLDAQYVRVGRFGRAVPQRRRRVFLVGYSGAGGVDPRAVLFDRESLRGNPAPRRQAGEGSSADARSGVERGGGRVVASAVSPCLRAGGNSAKDYGADAMADCIPTLRAGGHTGSHANAGVMPAVAFAQNSRDEVRIQGDGQVSGALAADEGMKQRTYLAAQWGVRRLTPRECERLQAFPDDFTRIEWRGKPASQCPDGPRYKALGNSMAVNVMAWIGERIAAVEEVANSARRAA